MQDRQSNLNSGNPVLYSGSNNSNSNYGLFYENYTSTGNTNSNLGGRLLVILHFTARIDPYLLVKI